MLCHTRLKVKTVYNSGIVLPKVKESHTFGCGVAQLDKNQLFCILLHEYKPDSFLVVHEGLLEFSLLLQNTGQVGVSRSKLWEHLDTLKPF